MALGGAIGPPSATICWCIHHLGRNPAVRERLEAEVDQVLGGEPIEPFDRERLPYASAVVKESFRLSPAATFTDKKATVDCVLGGYLIPKGTAVYPSSGLVHRREDCFDRPLEFRPERWLQGGAADLPPHAYFPFGQGFRICLGAGLATRINLYFIAALAQRWRLEPVSKRPVRAEFPLPGPYRIKGGLEVRARRRPALNAGQRGGSSAEGHAG